MFKAIKKFLGVQEKTAIENIIAYELKAKNTPRRAAKKPVKKVVKKKTSSPAKKTVKKTVKKKTTKKK